MDRKGAGTLVTALALKEYVLSITPQTQQEDISLESG